METQRCARCGCEEHIPTHQFVKFDLHLHYLCRGCWDRFKGWFRAGKGSGACDGYAAEAA